MIRFVYPNAKPRENKFIGCGRFFASLPENDFGLKPVNPDIVNVQEVMDAAEKLAPESFHSEKTVYEIKDIPEEKYEGDSLDLAYLLALISRSQEVAFCHDTHETDIWCTGCIDIKNNEMPYLKQVKPPGFSIKLRAFISQDKDVLFIVPVANIQPEHKKLLEDSQVRLLFLKQLQKDKAEFAELLKQKTILAVHGTELKQLTGFIFPKPADTAESNRKKRFLFFLIAIIFMIAVPGVFMLYQKFHQKSQNSLIMSYDSKLQNKKPENLTEPETGMIFVWIPGGCFDMGCDTGADDTCSEYETSVHRVCVDGFWLGKHEVTQAQWIKRMGSNPSWFMECGPDCPVEQVSWNDVKAFIQKLNENNKIAGAFCLPTEAQWEFACKNGGTENILPEIIEADTTYKTGQIGEDISGLCDMKTNVMEWCDDTFSHTAYQGHSLNNPVYTGQGQYKVARGSSWSMPSAYLPCTHRSKYLTDAISGNVGFRLIWVPSENSLKG
ncbi:Sulfatase-modifying factor enzyme domain-containing protein [Desulfonema limicola]|uniref:Sulfatase-modifying factor enzyme domain-containing protein n=2 Tax=Desulfonema limicola TaxID=45656 RepID=A0A975GJS9_9BACT|nr:Sulfatase-modifying factor enzyme domain-containing protein [Desulfonema limicola]